MVPPRVHAQVVVCPTQLSQWVAVGALEAGRGWVEERVHSLESNRCAAGLPGQWVLALLASPEAACVHVRCSGPFLGCTCVCGQALLC